MLRRRHRPREIPFSFDSFLDIVANVVGVIIRLILIVWVGARSYSSVKQLAQHPPPVTAVTTVERAVEDPLERELEEHRRELARLQERLLAQLRDLGEVQEQQGHTEHDLAALAERRQRLETAHADLRRAVADRDQTSARAALSLAELRQRREKLLEELRALERQPPLKKALRYRTPVSRPVHAEELMFECRQGRVTFVDLGALLREVRRGLEDKAQVLRGRWQVSETAGPVGAFRLHYTLERERGVLGAAGAGPEAEASFRYGLTSWRLEALADPRGEPAEKALAEGSEFRRIIDVLDPQQTVVTIWVYPDSFAAYRRLRDYLHERDVVVAGRPLPDGVPIASSLRGTVSRGQ